MVDLFLLFYLPSGWPVKWGASLRDAPPFPFPPSGIEVLWSSPGRRSPGAHTVASQHPYLYRLSRRTVVLHGLHLNKPKGENQGLGAVCNITVTITE